MPWDCNRIRGCSKQRTIFALLFTCYRRCQSWILYFSKTSSIKMRSYYKTFAYFFHVNTNWASAAKAMKYNQWSWSSVISETRPGFRPVEKCRILNFRNLFAYRIVLVQWPLMHVRLPRERYTMNQMSWTLCSRL